MLPLSKSEFTKEFNRIQDERATALPSSLNLNRTSKAKLYHKDSPIRHTPKRKSLSELDDCREN